MRRSTTQVVDQWMGLRPYLVRQDQGVLEGGTYMSSHRFQSLRYRRRGAHIASQETALLHAGCMGASIQVVAGMYTSCVVACLEYI